MTILQLNPPLWVETPLGSGWAHIYENAGINSDCFWVVALETGASVSFRNDQIRFSNSYTYGRWNPGLKASLMKSSDRADVDMRKITGVDGQITTKD